MCAARCTGCQHVLRTALHLSKVTTQFISHVRQLVPKLSSSLENHKWMFLSLDTWLKEFGKGCLHGKIWVQSQCLTHAVCMLPVVGVCSGVFQNKNAQQLVGWTFRNADIWTWMFFKSVYRFCKFLFTCYCCGEKKDITWRCSDL